MQGYTLAAQVHELEVDLYELKKEQGIWAEGMHMGWGEAEERFIRLGKQLHRARERIEEQRELIQYMSQLPEQCQQCEERERQLEEEGAHKQERERVVAEAGEWSREWLEQRVGELV